MKRIFLLFLISLIGVASAQDVILYDSMVDDTADLANFTSYEAWNHRENWTQVPYGNITHAWVGDPIIFNGVYWLFFPNNNNDGPYLYGSYNEYPDWNAEIYSNRLNSSFCQGSIRNLIRSGINKSIIIYENTADSVSISEAATDGYDLNGYAPLGCSALTERSITKYTSRKNIHLIEIEPMTVDIYDIAIHSSPNNQGAFVSNDPDGDDMIRDRNQYFWLGLYGTSWVYADSQHNRIGIQQLYSGGATNAIYGYIPQNGSASNFRMGYIRETGTAPLRLGTIRSNVQIGQQNNKTYIGYINQSNIWKNNDVSIGYQSIGYLYNSSVQIGTDIVSGVWRTTGMMNSSNVLGDSMTYHTKNVTSGYLNFTFPYSGYLKEFSYYLYDRTPDTPSSTFTVMDLWNEFLNINNITITNQTTIIRNGGFESGNTEWSSYLGRSGNYLTVENGSEGSLIGKTNFSGTLSATKKFWQYNVSLKPDTRYRLAFAAYSNTGHDVTVQVIKDTTPWTNYGLNQTFDIGTDWGNYSGEFTTSGFVGTTYNARLQFLMNDYAVSGDEYYYDNIQITEGWVPEYPQITTQWNNKTNNESLSLSLDISESVLFNVTCGNCTSYVWKAGDTILSETSDSLARSWEVNGSYYISAYGILNNSVSNTVSWNVLVNSPREPDSYVPPIVTDILCTPTLFTVSCSWLPVDGNVTDEYRLEINDSSVLTTVYNRTSTSYIFDTQAHHNISFEVYSYNASGAGTFNETGVYTAINISNNAVTLDDIADQTLQLNELFEQIITYTDADNDDITITQNESSPGTISNPTKIYSFIPDTAGVYSVILTGCDSYGSCDSIQINFTALPDYNAHGYVVSASGLGVSYPEVYLMYENNTFINYTVGDSNGFFTFSDVLPNGNYYGYGGSDTSINYTNFSVPINTSLTIDSEQVIFKRANKNTSIDYTGSIGDSLTYSIDDEVNCINFILGVGICSFDSADTYSVSVTATDMYGFESKQKTVYYIHAEAVRRKIAIWFG